MKKIKITVDMTVTNDFYEKHMLELKNDILSGNSQREILKDEGIKKITVFYEELKS